MQLLFSFTSLLLLLIAAPALAFIAPVSSSIAAQSRVDSRLAMSTISYPSAMDAIKVGDELPDTKVKIMNESGDMEDGSIKDLFKGKKGILFGIPGAFTPTCESRHVPSYLENLDKLKEKGVEVIACVAVNDFFIMKKFSKELDCGGKVVMIADGSGELAAAMGLQLDLRDKGLGMRCKRYAVVVDDDKVKYIGEDDDSFAEPIMAHL